MNKIIMQLAAAIETLPEDIWQAAPKSSENAGGLRTGK